MFLFMRQLYAWSCLVYVLAFFTDVLDGYIARKHDWITNIGKVLDPLADKLMMIAALLCFYRAGKVPLFILLIAMCKEVLMITIGAFLYTKKVVVYADWFGKIATGLFVIAVVLTFADLIFGVNCGHFYVYLLALAAGVISFFHYGIKTFIRKQGNGRLD